MPPTQRKQANPAAESSHQDELEGLRQENLALQARLQVVNRAHLREEMEIEAIYDTAPIGMCILDHNLCFVRINQKLAEMNGLPVEEHIGKTPGELVPDLEDQIMSAGRRVLETGEPLMNIEFNGETNAQPGVQRVWNESWMPIRDEHGRVTGISVIIEEITERKSAEEALRRSEERYRDLERRFRLALENTPIAVYSMDCNLRYTWVYNSRRNFKPENLIGKTDGELVGLAQAARFTAVKRKVITSGKPVRAEIAVEDGENAGIYLLHLEPLKDEHGNIIGLIGASNEITELRQLEARQVENLAHIEMQHRLIQQRELERVEIARDLHDGPLQDLSGTKLNLLDLGENLSEDLRPQMDVIVQLIDEQINELRHFCSELRPPALAPFGLEKAIRSHIETFRQRHASINVNLNLMRDGTILAENARLALFRIYQELLNNIVKHASASHVMISLLVSDDEVVLDVEDDGVGFTLPGNWLDLMRSGHLGLVGMRERVEAVGGRLSVLSSPGRGTSVQASVPRKQE